MTTAERTHVGSAYSVFYSFKGGSGDGANPHAGLINVNGTLYGTTVAAGPHYIGTVFAITTSGKETVLYSFGGGSYGGAYPFAGLVDVNGTLYGTTYQGGAIDYGTVFSVTTSGTETVLHSFGVASGDGLSPTSGLINIKGTLYSTTFSGDRAGCFDGLGCGTVFKITTSGAETVLHGFGASGDGQSPAAGLINIKGTFYGTTQDGGEYGDGTVFSLTPSGTETVLHSFKAGKGDGENPEAGLLDVDGTLYGTTYNGGLKDRGTVFAITTSGKETVIHSFSRSGDGKFPEAGLINVKGTFYGTTYEGGAHSLGTVFSITPSGTETVLHSFAGKPDGENPEAGLLDVDGTLYGTTYYGGTNNQGAIFSLTP
jgi:uncharacterized repeat protein (TIGR03803 family)